MALTISGCSEVPEDVRSRTEAKNQAISEAEKHLEERTGEIRYISPDELEEDVKAAYIRALGLKDVQRNLIDIQTKEVWFEAKLGALSQKRISFRAVQRPKQ